MSTLESFSSSNPSLAERTRRSSHEAPIVPSGLPRLSASPYTLEQHCHHALLLATQHVVGPGSSRNPLRRQLDRATKILHSSQKRWNRMVGEGQTLPPAALGLLESFHLIDEHLAIAKQESRRRFSSPLPQLAAGSTFGTPRVYQIATELIVHSDGQVDIELLTRVVAAYQSRATLALRELWAMSAVLRLAVLEHLSRVALRLVNQELNNTPAGHVRSQTAEQLSITTGIGALRNLGSIDWRGFVEEQSTVEAILRRDPLAIYPQMSPQSRDRYRRMVENLAIRSPLTESQVADAVVELANVGRVALDSTTRASTVREGMKERHVGYFLVDKGLPALEARIGYRPGRRENLARAARSAPLACFVTAIVSVSATIIAAAAVLGWFFGAGHFLSATSAGLLLLVWSGIAVECAVRIVNSLCTMMVKPRAVMRLDFSEGIPDDCRTLVAIPTMLSSDRAVRDLVDLLEVRYLANRDENLLFALVTDFPDAAAATLPTDAALLDLARSEIERLNGPHGETTSEGVNGPFYLLHRPRKWNAHEQKWMGEERKRGKLGALNQLLRGHDGDFSLTVGELDELLSVRYVITLDSDTQLPRDAARELIASMAHPLNRPRIDRQSRMVVEGHAILQPRVATTMPEARRSLYAHIFSGDAGTDPYTQQTSDVYQDIFGEGSFIGKGIYDVDAFETVLEGRFPENRVLSHDLIEGCFARSGLINDVELFEGFPSRLPADMSRRHRWIRGDWQIAAWLFSKAPNSPIESSTLEAVSPPKNPLSLLSRWKIADNLRRSLSPVALFAFFVAALLFAPTLAACCTGLILAAIFVPELVGLMPAFFLKPAEKPWSLHLSDRMSDLGRLIGREAINWSMLPYTVHCNVDAVVRAIYRMAVSGRKLLEWTTASEAERRCSTSCRDYYELLWACPVAGLAAVAWLAIVQPTAFATAGLLAVAWIFAPLIAWLISRPRTNDASTLNETERTNFRDWARRTWHFFDTFVNEESHGLPPDNVQFDDQRIIAHRTSPTNIGLGLLSDLSAYDLGYLSAGRFLERTGLTLQTLQKLERYRGHFFNWYNTQTLEPLGHRYVSAVDSGNLRGAFIVVQAAMDEMRNRPIVSPRLCEGFQDTFNVLAKLSDAFQFSRVACDALSAFIASDAAKSRTGAKAALRFMDEVDALAAKTATHRIDDPVVQEWLSALGRQLDSIRNDIASLAFWLDDDCLQPLVDLETDDAETSEIRTHATALRTWLNGIDANCTLSGLPSAAAEAIGRIQSLCELLSTSDIAVATSAAVQLAAMARRATAALVAAVNELRQAQSLAEMCQNFGNMDYRFLYNKPRKLLAIGFNVSEHKLDASCYDLLASECRLASFLAVSDGQLPAEHWSALGRTVAVHGGTPTLISWSGSMFEYLMPMLIMPSYRTSFLDTSCRKAVQRQMQYAKQHSLPWGISESCFHQRNDDGAYSYRAFGVPGLRLEQRSDKSFVIAPYASALAAMVTPRRACQNLLRLEGIGSLCSYGFYESIDYTALPGAGEKRPGSNPPAACRTVMSHHSGMALVAMANVLLDSGESTHSTPMRRRFMADARLRAHDLLLQQRMPQSVRPVNWRKHEAINPLTALLEANPPKISVFESAHSAANDRHALGNAHNGIALTASGSPGRYCYIRDVDSGDFWSNTLQPTMVRGDKSQAVFSPGRAQFRMLCQQINAQTLVTYSAEDRIEVRRIKLANLARAERSIELTTYAEVGQSAQVESINGGISGAAALLATWPPHTSDPSGFMFHLVRAIDRTTTSGGFESSRTRFVGPGRTLAEPIALDSSPELTGTAGTFADAVLSLRETVTLGAGESVELDIVTGHAATRDEAIAAIHRYIDPRLSWRLFELADAAARVQACTTTVES